MPSSNLSAITPITERSAANPALWNTRFTQIDTNFSALGPIFQFNVRAYGALGDGTNDDTAAIQLAITAAATAGWGKVYFPRGTYLVTDTLNVTGLRTHLEGEGRYVTQLIFKPTSAKACVKFQNANTAQVLYQCSIQHISFVGHSSATAIQKIAIDAYDTSGLYIHDVTVQTWTGNSGSVLTPSTGFRSNGREATTVFFVEFSCDRPFWLRANANSASLDVDSFTFWDCYCTVQAATESSYEIDTQIGLSNVVIGGRQSWVQGKYGIHWNSVGAMRATALNIKILNARFEQATAAGGYAIYWTGGTNNLTLENVGFGGVTNANTGLYVRNTVYPLLISCSYSGTGVVIDADGTSAGINTLEWRQCLWTAGATATIAGLTQTLALPKYVSGAPLPPTAMYVTTSMTIPAIKILGTGTDFQQGTLANGVAVTLYMSATGATTAAIVDVVLTETGGTHKREGASFVIGDNGATKIGGTSNTTVGNFASNLCLLYNSPNSIQILNSLGVTTNYIVRTAYMPS